MRKYAVFGAPILHSKSPEIYNFLFKYDGIDAHYTRVFAKTSNEVLKIFLDFNLSGANITSPLKKNILTICNSLSDEAKNTGAVNTILYNQEYTQGPFQGFNTDVLGFWYTLYDELKNILTDSGDTQIQNKKIAIIGAGGAADAVASALIKNTHNCQINIINRTYDKALILADKYNLEPIRFDTFSSAQAQNYDIIIITIPAPENSLSKIDFSKKSILIFADYRCNEYFQKLKQQNIRAVSGHNWLINQAVLVYKIYNSKNKLTKTKTSTPDIIPLLNNLLNSTQDLNSNTLPYNTNIYLTGFSGAGKSFLGAKLAEKLNSNFIDLDKLIEDSAGKSIQKIFSEDGEDFFRKTELQLFEKITNTNYFKNKSNKYNIISLGAGFDLTLINSIKKKEKIIYLYSELKESLERIKNSNVSRPKLQNLNHKEILNIYTQRKEKYFNNSDFIIYSNNNTLENLLSELR